MPQRQPWPRLGRFTLAISLALGAGRNADAVIVVSQPGDEHQPGRCSLREAVQSANTATAPPDTDCAAGTPGASGISIPYPRIELVHGSLEIDGGVSISGASPTGSRTVITRSADAADFGILHRTGRFASSSCTLDRLDITGGVASVGGGIHSEGRLGLVDSVVTGNTASDTGGGIYANQLDRIDIVGSSIVGNTSSGKAGGIYTNAPLTVDASTIAYNAAQAGDGGGLYAATLFTVVSNSTISGNSARSATAGSGNGGGVFLVPYAIGQFSNSTVTRNTTNGNGSGAGLYVVPGDVPGYARVTLSSTIVQDNVSGKYEENLAAGAGLTIAGDRDLIGRVSSEIAVPADTLDCDAKMGMLADNGGPTPTIAIAAGSCAIDQGIDNGFDTDQRGSGFARTVGLRADIGAFEYDADRLFADGFEGDPG